MASELELAHHEALLVLTSDPNPEVRLLLANGLNFYKDVLERLASDKDPRVAAAASSAIARIRGFGWR